MTTAVQRLVPIACLALAAGGLGLWLARDAPPADRAPPAAPQEDEEGDPDALPVFRPGSSTERRITGGESHDYRLTLPAGDYLELVVEQHDVDVEVELSDPVGETVLQVDSPYGSEGSETVMAATASAGDYRLTVSAYEPQPEGRYRIEITARRPSADADRRRAAAAYAFARGEDLQQRRQYSDAERAFAESMEGWRALEDGRWQGETLDRLGRIYAARNDWRRVVTVRQRASVLFRETGELQSEAENQRLLGLAFLRLGDIRSSLNARSESLGISQTTGNREGEALAWNDLGILYKRLGEVQKAVDYYTRALARWRELADRRQQAKVLSNLGSLDFYLGRNDRALDRFREAEEVWRELDDPASHAVTLDRMGQLSLRLGHLDAARESLERALELRRIAGDRRGEAITLANLGWLLRENNDLDAARERYQKALEIFAELGVRRNEAQVLQNLGGIDNAAGRPRVGLETTRRARALYRELQDPKGEADCLVQISISERRLGRLEAARDPLERAFEIYESLRRQALGPELRAAYFATLQEHYESYGDLLMELHLRHPYAGWDARALAASERARARSLLDTLEQAVMGRRNVDPELVERERAVLEALDLAERLRAGDADSSPPTAADRVELDRRLRELSDQLAELRTRMRLADPQSGWLAAAEPLDVEEIQRQVLDTDTLLLEIELGSERSFLWRVSPDQLASFELPPRETIERATRDAYRFLTVSHRRESAARERRARCELAQLLLGPVAGTLAGKRLLIAAEGTLQMIPFAALPVVLPAASNAADACAGTPPMVAEHEIVQLPSASLLAALRRRAVDRPQPRGSVAVVADPVFEMSDPRVRRVAPTDLDDPTILASSGRIPRGNLPRLPNSRREARAILDIAPTKNNFEALDFAASKSTVRNGVLADYRFVHFATHAVIDAEHPELSRLVLSQVAGNGDPLDGRLYAHEIYNLDLAAELIVLSACRTALGKKIRGEGLIGVTQAFFSAGTSRLIVGLWDVDDRATAELMERLYHGILVDDLPPAAALRQAQLGLWNQKRWRAPYYWAGFVVQGEWR